MSSGQFNLQFIHLEDDPQNVNAPMLGFCNPTAEGMLGHRSFFYSGGFRTIILWTSPDRDFNLSTIVHEIGHTLGWEHSGSCDSNIGLDCEYDNPLDVMSGGSAWQGTTCENIEMFGWNTFDSQKCYWDDDSKQKQRANLHDLIKYWQLFSQS